MIPHLPRLPPCAARSFAVYKIEVKRLDFVELLTHFGLTKKEANIDMMLITKRQLSGYEAAKLTGISFT
jgi:hypothetical protein